MNTEMLESVADSDNSARAIVAEHIGNGTERPRCTICETWWPCDIVALAARAALNADALAASRQREQRLADALETILTNVSLLTNGASRESSKWYFGVIASVCRAALAEAPAEQGEGGE